MNRARHLALAGSIAFVLALLLPCPGAGQDREDLIDRFPIHRSEGLQGPVAVAYNPLREEYLAVWTNERRSGVFSRRVRVRPHRARGLRPRRLVSAATGLPSEVAVAYNPLQDTYLVAWIAFNSSRVWGTVVDWQGRPLGPGSEISDLPPEADCRPFALSVTHNSVDDSWLVVWQDNCTLPEVELGSLARVLDGNGVATGASFRVHDKGKHAAVAFDALRNRYLVVRGSERATRILARLHEADGDRLGSTIEVTRRPGTVQSEPNVVWIPDTDRWLVVWRDGNSVAGALIDGLGVLPSFSISEPGIDFSGHPQAASLSYSPFNRQVLVVWEHNNDLFGRWVDRLGGPQGPIRSLRTDRGLRWLSRYGLACSQAKPRCLLAWSEARQRSFFNDFNVWGGSIAIPPDAAE